MVVVTEIERKVKREVEQSHRDRSLDQKLAPIKNWDKVH